jgi:hypothetical protein
MVPFSFHQALLKSRVMKERSLPSSPPRRAEASAKGDLRLGGKSVRRGGASNDSRGGCAPQNKDGSSVTLVTLVKNTKTTKRTQFEKCKSPIKH